MACTTPPRSLGTGGSNKSRFEKNSEDIIKWLNYYKTTKTGKLYQYQIDAVLKMRAVVLKDQANNILGSNETKPALIVAPTGSGKSGMIVLLPYVLPSKRVLIITPSKCIGDQLSFDFGDGGETFPCFLEKVDLLKYENRSEVLERVRVIEKPEHFDNYMGNLVIVNAQKFGGRAQRSLRGKYGNADSSARSLLYDNSKVIEDVEKFFAKFDTLIVDEAHYFPAKTWLNIVKEFSSPVPGVQKKIIFLTATPYKNIKGKLVSILGPENKHDDRVFEVKSEQVDGITTRIQRFKQVPYDGQINICNDPNDTFKAKFLKDIDNLFEENKSRESGIKNPKAMILVRLKVEAKTMVKYLNKKKGKNFAIELTGDTKNKLPKFKNGKYQVAVTCGIGTVGLDDPDVIVCVILRRITKGVVLFNQFIGRCKRFNNKLEPRDQSIGTVFTYESFNLKTMWDMKDSWREEDPVDDDDEQETSTKTAEISTPTPKISSNTREKRRRRT